MRELNLAAVAIARRAADDYSTPDKPRWVAGSIGPGTKFPTLGQIRYADLRDAYEEQSDALIEGGADLIIIETVFDLLQAKAAINGARRAMRRAGVRLPIQCQVTIELTGTMLPGTEVGAALVALQAMDIDVIGLNCATGPSEMFEPLRHLTGHADDTGVVPAQRRAPLGGRRQDALRPRGPPAGRVPPSVRLRARRLGHRGLLRHHAGVPAGRRGGLRRPHPGRAQPRARGGRGLDLHPRPLHPGQLVPGRGRAHQRQRLEEVPARRCSRPTGTPAWPWPRTRSRRVRTSSTCASTTPAPTAWPTWSEVASRFATQSTAPLMVDSTEAPVIETALSWIGGRAVINSVNLEEGDAEGTRLDSFLTLAKEFGAAVVCTCIDEEGQARTADWKVRAARAIHDIAVERYGLRPQDLLFDPLALPLSTGMEESRRDGIETIEGIRRIKAELPGVYTVLGLSNVSFGLNPAARQVLNSVFLHECVEAGLDAAIVHASKILPLAKIDERAKEVCLDLIYDRRTDTYDPLSELLALFEGVSASSVAAAEDRSGWTVERPPRAPDHRRRPQRHRGRPGRGHGAGPHAADHHQRVPAGRHEDGRRALRLGRDAAALRARLGGDHEGGRRLPRALHGEGRPGRQGHHGARHGEGRRPRHRQEPGRHHPDQQRLHGPEPRDQDRHRRDGGRGRGIRRRRHRDERAPGEVHADHAREPGGAQPTRARPTSR